MAALVESVARYHESGVCALWIDGVQIDRWLSRDEAYQLLTTQAVQRSKGILLTSLDSNDVILFREVFTLSGAILPYFEPIAPAVPVTMLPVAVLPAEVPAAPEPVLEVAPEPVAPEPEPAPPVVVAPEPEPDPVPVPVIEVAPVVLEPIYVCPDPAAHHVQLAEYNLVLEPDRPVLMAADFIPLDSRRESIKIDNDALFG